MKNIKIKSWPLFIPFMCLIILSCQAQKKSKETKIVKDFSNWKQVGEGFTYPGNYGEHTAWVNGVGKINTLEFDPIDDSTIYAGSSFGGIWKSVNNGETWSNIGINVDKVFERIAIADIVISPINNKIIYVATGNDNNNVDGTIVGGIPKGNSSGIFKTEDGGKTWNSVSPNDTDWGINPENKKRIAKLMMHPLNPNILFVAIHSYTWGDTLLSNYGAFYKTIDGGKSWKNLSSQFKDPFLRDIEFHPANPHIIYASGHRVYRSKNSSNETERDGEDWEDVTSNLSGFTPQASLNHSNRIMLAVTPAQPDKIFMLACGFCINGEFIKDQYHCKGSFEDGIWVSEDGLETATRMQALRLGSGNFGHYVMDIGASPLSPNMVYVSGRITIKSTDGGSSFIPLYNYGDGTVHPDIHWLSVRKNGELWLGHDGGISASFDEDKTFVNRSNGMMVLQFHKFGISKSDEKVLGGTQDVGTMIYSDKEGWIKINVAGDGFECIIDPENSDTVYFSDYQRSGSVYRSFDGGKSINAFIRPTGEGNFRSLVMHPLNKNTLFCGMRDVYQSENKGTKWNKISDFKSYAIPTYQNITTIEVSGTDPKIILAAFPNYLFKTVDGGKTWEDLTPFFSKLGVTGVITGVVTHPKNPNIIFITFDGYLTNKNENQNVFLSKDGGKSWQNFSKRLPSVPTNCIVIDYKSSKKGTLYIGTDKGVFTSGLTGIKKGTPLWRSFNNNLPNTIISELEIDYPERAIYVATYGRGVWKSRLKDNRKGGKNKF